MPTDKGSGGCAGGYTGRIAGAALAVGIFFATASSLIAPVFADLLGHAAPVRDVAIAPGGDLAITSGFDDVAILWALPQEDQIARLYGHEAAVNAAAYLAPDRAVTVSDDGTARIWDLTTGTALKVLRGHDSKVVGVAVSPDGRMIATASWDRTVILWEGESGAQITRFTGHDGPVNAVRFVAGGSQLISAGYDGAIRLWPVGPDAPRATLFANAGFPINDIALLRGGGQVVTASADGILRVWDLASGQIVRALTAHEGAVLAVAASADGTLIASGGTDGRLVLWRATDTLDAPSVEVALPHYRAVWSIDFSPDGQAVYASGVDRVTRGFRTRDGEPLGGEVTPFKPIERVSRALANSENPVERGSYQFRKCAVCHALTADSAPKAGPTLAGIFGRRVGGLARYSYSEALQAADFTWTPQSVSELFEKGPDVMLPGTKMPIQRLPDARDRADLMAFLKQATASGQ